jgi:NADH-quinone oxidoreductase subunit E
LSESEQKQTDDGWSAETDESISRLLGHYPDRMAALLPVLTAVQREKNWLSRATMDRIAERLELSKRHVYGVATFYTMYNTEPVGQWHLQLCQNLSCSLVGGVQILAHLERKLGISVGQTTADKRFTLTTVECLGSCGTGPVLQINDVYHENLTIGKVDEILEGLD